MKIKVIASRANPTQTVQPDITSLIGQTFEVVQWLEGYREAQVETEQYGTVVLNQGEFELPTKLSKVGRDCLCYMIAQPGTIIIRHTGGSWSRPGRKPSWTDTSFAKATLVALAQRGLVLLEMHHNTAHGTDYPVAATLSEAGKQEAVK